MTTTVIRTLLLVDILAMVVLALVYLRQRRVSWPAFCAWSLLAMLVPLLGPFLVIAIRPGGFRAGHRPVSAQLQYRSTSRTYGPKGKLQ